jgi:hypothetical protein
LRDIYYLRLAAIGVPADRGVPMADPFATVEPFTEEDARHLDAAEFSWGIWCCRVEEVSLTASLRHEYVTHRQVVHTGTGLQKTARQGVIKKYTPMNENPTDWTSIRSIQTLCR